VQLSKINLIFGLQQSVTGIFIVKEMQRRSLSYKHAEISFLRFGTGPRRAFCFHGYGEDGESFAFLGSHFSKTYTFYAIDLPYHGATQWQHGKDLTADDVCSIIRRILAQEDGPHGNEDAITLIGFSLGGRVALAAYEQLGAEVDRLVLLAPDGLKVNFWYWLATQTWAGNKLFYYTMKHPGWFISMLKILNRLHVVNPSIFKFVNFYISDAKVRLALYERWMAMRKLRPSITKIKRSIRERQTTFRLLYGIHDRIIRPARGEKFRRGIEANCEIIILSCGHQVLHPKQAQEIVAALLQ
jgi:pimeloyl-ACP methyl ester carboxylesterase